MQACNHPRRRRRGKKRKNNNRASVRWNYTNKFSSCNDIIFLVVVVVYAPGSIKYAASFLFLYKKMIYLYHVTLWRMLTAQDEEAAKKLNSLFRLNRYDWISFGKWWCGWRFFGYRIRTGNHSEAQTEAIQDYFQCGSIGRVGTILREDSIPRCLHPWRVGSKVSFAVGNFSLIGLY